jgi:hypothetical protein
MLKNSGVNPMEDGPTRWWIDSSEDGWMIRYEGPISGAMHPKTFCQIMIDALNEDVN